MLCAVVQRSASAREGQDGIAYPARSKHARVLRSKYLDPTQHVWPDMYWASTPGVHMASLSGTALLQVLDGHVVYTVLQ